MIDPESFFQSDAGAPNEPDSSSRPIPQNPEVADNAPLQATPGQKPQARKPRVFMAYVLVPPHRKRPSVGQRPQEKTKARLQSRSRGSSRSGPRTHSGPRSRSRPPVDVIMPGYAKTFSRSSHHGPQRRPSQKNSSTAMMVTSFSSQGKPPGLSPRQYSLAGRRPSRGSAVKKPIPRPHARSMTSAGSFGEPTAPVPAPPNERGNDQLGATNFLSFCFRMFPSLVPDPSALP